MALSYLDFKGEHRGDQSKVATALAKANEYLAKNDVDVVNVETLWVDHGIPSGVRVWFRTQAAGADTPHNTGKP
jgi:hypothetical protein